MFLIPQFFYRNIFLAGTLDILGQRGRATMGSGATPAQATPHHPRRPFRLKGPFRKAGLEMRQDVFL